jgi:hypothetical protein
MACVYRKGIVPVLPVLLLLLLFVITFMKGKKVKVFRYKPDVARGVSGG